MPNVRCGLDRLAEYADLLGGKRLGLLTTPAAVTADLSDSIEAVRKLYNLTALYSPEHGVRGDRQAGEAVDTFTDERTGIPVYSTYGHTVDGMTPEQTEHFDILLFDAQDVGCRFYTYLAALMEAMKACAKAGKPLVVLDRPNPAGCTVTAGNVPTDPAKRCIVSAWEMPAQYGMTIGEFARMVNAEEKIGCELTVIPVEGYRRDMTWEETGLFYVNASPNLPNMDSIRLYSGTCLFEGTCLSEGRGTTHPFEIVGAPWIDPYVLADKMNAYGLAGVRFRPTYFMPTFSKHQGKICGGVQVHLTGGSINAPEIGLRLLREAKNLSPAEDFWLYYEKLGYYFIDRLLGGNELRDGEFDPDEILPRWEKVSAEFRERSRAYWLYE
ncbi:MAG: DUF1343 domain-containing protein [Oscillospiraceae bacterium]|nr:DUF1343 domain-containing protein [Oscillospiraceae bacterium]